MHRRPRRLQALAVAALVGIVAWGGCAAPAATTGPGGATPAPRAAAAEPAQPPVPDRVKISTAGQSMTSTPSATKKPFRLAI